MSFRYDGNQLTNCQLSRIYNNMYKRCYAKWYQQNEPHCRDCTVCREWYNPDHPKTHSSRQYNYPEMHAFYEWVREHHYSINGEPTIELDKDIKGDGKYVYSPDTCLFVPKSVNNFFRSPHQPKVDGLPVGITKSQDELYVVKIKKREKNFETLEQAFDYWRTYKEGGRDQLLSDYEGSLPQEVVDAIMNYSWEITDR